MNCIPLRQPRVRQPLAWLHVIAATFLLASAASAQDTGGSKTWGRYTFNWSVTNSAGLTLQDVTYDGTYYIYSASMPVVRVQYADDTCGPYMDRLGRSFIVKDETDNYVRFAEADGKLYVSIKAQIASYALEQQWVFNRGGRIDARLFSSGLQCQIDHRHHPYWRIDADVGEPGYDEIRARYRDGRIALLSTEANLRKNASLRPTWWSFRDAKSGRQLILIPGRRDGRSDSFAQYDFYARAYQEPWEHEPWASNTGGFGDQGDLVLSSADGETIGPGSETTDVLGWYIAHLAHPASVGSSHVESVGPSLLLR